MALINFRLKHPDNITPWNAPPDTSMHWFGLTEGEYWLDVNKATLYEYTNEVLAGNNANDSHYVDYQIARLLEDLTSLFDAIAEPVPDAFYAIARSNDYLYRFYAAAQNWFEHASKEASTDADSSYDSYDKSIEWIYSRTLTAGHLAYEPGISFFRNKDNISIVWNADHLTEHNIPVWTAQNGEVEMAYQTFIYEIEDFGNRFFHTMDAQVKLAIEKNRGATQLDKEQLIQEQQSRKEAFQQKLSLLKGAPTKHTDWNLINSLITKMFS